MGEPQTLAGPTSNSPLTMNDHQFCLWPKGLHDVIGDILFHLLMAYQDIPNHGNRNIRGLARIGLGWDDAFHVEGHTFLSFLEYIGMTDQLELHPGVIPRSVTDAVGRPRPRSRHRFSYLARPCRFRSPESLPYDVLVRIESEDSQNLRPSPLFRSRSTGGDRLPFRSATFSMPLPSTVTICMLFG